MGSDVGAALTTVVSVLHLVFISIFIKIGALLLLGAGGHAYL